MYISSRTAGAFEIDSCEIAYQVHDVRHVLDVGQ